MKHENPIWSIERALQYGYVIEPRTPTSCFSGPLRMSRPSHDCAVRTASIYRDQRNKVPGDWGQPACEKQCAECAHICHMNDYVRGKEHCPPHYPVPAIWQEPRCLFCGSMDGMCHMHPMDCLEGKLKLYVLT